MSSDKELEALGPLMTLRLKLTAAENRIEQLSSENEGLLAAINLERRLKNRFIGALEKAGIDPDDVPALDDDNECVQLTGVDP